MSLMKLAILATALLSLSAVAHASNEYICEVQYVPATISQSEGLGYDGALGVYTTDAPNCTGSFASWQRLCSDDASHGRCAAKLAHSRDELLTMAQMLRAAAVHGERIVPTIGA